MSFAKTAVTAARRRPDADRLLTWLCVGLPLLGLVLFFLYPMVIVFLRSLTVEDGYGLANYSQVLASAGFWRATWHSLLMGGTTTALSVFLGFIIAHGLHRCAFPGKWLVRGVIVLPLLAPSLVQALGLIFLLGRNGVVSRALGIEIEIYGFWGLLIANTLYALPQAVMIIGAALVLLDARTYEAAEVMGASPSRQFRDLTLPAARFGILNAAFVCFTITITDFGNAAVIGGDYSVLATEIYSQVVGQRNFNMGAVVGIMLLLPTVVSYAIERQAMKRQQTGQATGQVRYRPSFAPLRDTVMAALALLICAGIVAVIGIVVYASFVTLWPYNMALSPKHYDITLAGGYSSLWMTIVISVMAATGGTLAVFLLGLGLRRLPRRAAQPIQVLAAMPAAVPGMVLGLAYILTFNSTATPLYLLYGTAALIAIINFYHYHTQGFLTLMTGFRQLPPALEEAAGSLGAGLGRTAVDIVAPFIAPMLVSVFFFLFMRSMVTLSAVVFLTTPDLSVAAVTIMRLDDAGLTSQAAAFSTCVMAVVCLALLSMKATLALMSRRKRSKDTA
ncbi:probable ABC transporter permease protein [Pseudooceanicola batsensis HTCC2597]|uniref:Probable ABC transporter permease protein n=1 Tax=Pseudooceanicola batsensis (strain ATCC BAA-863 / DSM 15984 / KCTC 12145 / HTCC2597) TaxID=252305 RepID=A3U1G8_PSEBH|nr:ABC transporter permease subunit [Pseudooceanicola batsensis]EAQ02151.1 probable ABC transporter permease protein [Pseudooceanicola batsensis HTCC2597]